MGEIIFYSWQSDLPNPTNRTLIEDALKGAAKALRQDESLQVEPVIDRDTSGVPGSPDIAATIFAKIDQAQVFVCDVSFVNPGAPQRLTPNPNVLIELGYALRALGQRRIIMVMNEVFGPVKELPFDLRLKRAITYTMHKEIADRATERRYLEKRLTEALRTIFVELSNEAPRPVAPGEAVREAVEGQRPDQATSVRRFMAWLVEQLDSSRPNFSQEGDKSEIFIRALEQTPALVGEFARVADTIARMNAEEAAREIYKGFEPLLERYDRRPSDPSTFWHVNDHVLDYDFYKFLGHELFVTFFSFLVREGRWSLIAELLREEFFLTNGLNGQRRMETFEYVCQWVELAKRYYDRLQQRYIAPHGQLLSERHAEGELAETVPLQQFMDADLFLFLRSSDLDERSGWTSWSTVNLHQLPRYLIEAQRQRYAQQLLQPLAVESIDELRQRLVKCQQRHGRLFDYPLRYNVLEDLDLGMIGSR
jgi:hypothetical protein